MLVRLQVITSNAFVSDELFNFQVKIPRQLDQAFADALESQRANKTAGTAALMETFIRAGKDLRAVLLGQLSEGSEVAVLRILLAEAERRADGASASTIPPGPRTTNGGDIVEDKPDPATPPRTIRGSILKNGKRVSHHT